MVEIPRGVPVWNRYSRCARGRRSILGSLVLALGMPLPFGDVLTAMRDRILSTEAAQALQDKSDRDGTLLSWRVMKGRDGAGLVARPIAAGHGALLCVLVAATLSGMHAQLPAGLKCSPRQPPGPPGVVEIWFSAG